MDSVNQLRSEGGPAPLLAMAGLVKRFTGTLALDHVDFDVRRGEVHALLGQNGAGKSTLIKVLAGVYQADGGDILFAGRPAHPETDALPIAFIHQDLGLVEWMTIAENVAIQTGYPRSRTGLISWPRVRDAAAEALAIMGSELDPETPGLFSAGRRAFAGRDRPGAGDQVGHPRSRRTDRGASRGRCRASARDACADCAPATSESFTSLIAWTRSCASPIE